MFCQREKLRNNAKGGGKGTNNNSLANAKQKQNKRADNQNQNQSSKEKKKKKNPTKAEMHDKAVAEAVFPESLNTPEFRTAFYDFCAERRDRKTYMTQRAIKMLFNQLEKYQVEYAIEALKASIANGYKGVFPNEAGLKTDKKQSKKDYSL